MQQCVCRQQVQLPDLLRNKGATKHMQLSQSCSSCTYMQVCLWLVFGDRVAGSQMHRQLLAVRVIAGWM